MRDYNEIISVDTWRPDETYDGVFPKGAREKTVYFTPDNPCPPFLRPNHRHLFKKSSIRYPWQFWMEVIARRVGQVMGVIVPPTYVALSEKEGGGQGAVYGALIEWFYDTEDIYVDGGRFMSRAIEGFDDHKGTQHNLKTILDLPLFESTRDTIIDYWAGVLTFDAIIGNVDRHQDNWGVIFPRSALDPDNKRSGFSFRLSPAFDNGTALAYEIIEQNFVKFQQEDDVLRYLTRPKRARHHMRWSLENPEDMNFFRFMRRFLEFYPQTRNTIENLLRFTREDIETRLFALPQIPVAEACRLTERRLDFIIRLIMKRKELLESSIEVY